MPPEPTMSIDAYLQYRQHLPTALFHSLELAELALHQIKQHLKESVSVLLNNSDQWISTTSDSGADIVTLIVDYPDVATIAHSANFERLTELAETTWQITGIHRLLITGVDIRLLVEHQGDQSCNKWTIWSC